MTLLRSVAGPRRGGGRPRPRPWHCQGRFTDRWHGRDPSL